MANNGTVSARQARFVAALLEASSVRDACDKAGIGERTGWRYLALEAVKGELSRRQDAALALACAQIAADAGQALATLRVMMDKGGDAQRVSAAGRVLANLLPLTELGTLAARVAALEEKTNASTTKKN